MARPKQRRALSVWMNGEHVGTWSTQGGRQDEFAYAPSWLGAEGARPISLSLPMQTPLHRGDPVNAYFDNLLPDSRPLRERIQRRYRAATIQPFDLLAEVGRDCVGAVQLLPEHATTPKVRAIEGVPLTPRAIERLLDDVRAPATGTGADDGEFRISLAGAQEKTALLQRGRRWLRPRSATPTTHIFKLPIGIGHQNIDLTTSIENEWLCARLLQAFDIPVADSRMARFGERALLIVERFDRRPAASGKWIMRLPQEDFCQAMGLPSHRKYEVDGGPGIRAIMTMLLGSTRAEQDRRDFFKTQMLYWMLCAIDGHAKNFSIFIEAGGGYRLTPRYDILSAWPVIGNARAHLPLRKVKMAMAIEGASRHYHWDMIQTRHWRETARRCGMEPAFETIREELLDGLPAAIARVEGQLPRGFPDAIARTIFAGLRRAAAKLRA